MRVIKGKDRVKIRIPVPNKPGKVILHEKDKEEEDSKKTSSEYIHEFLEETEDFRPEDDYDDGCE